MRIWVPSKEVCERFFLICELEGCQEAMCRLLFYSLWNCTVSCTLAGGACWSMIIQAVIWFVPGFIVYVLLLYVTYCVWYVVSFKVNARVTV